MADKSIIVGDVHCGPGQNLRRAVWLGRLIEDVKPNRVVYIGDFGTFDSLSAWDKDKRKQMEGRRFAKDVASLSEFNTLVLSSSSGHPSSNYETHITEGNHENRIERYIETKPELEGTLDYVKQANLKDWIVTPYKDFLVYGGVSFTHVPITESGKPVSGANATSKALGISSRSVIFGHTHRLDYKAVHRHGSPHLQESLNVGCFFEHIDDYAKGSITSYWRGLVVLDHYTHARFSFEAIPMGLLKKTYTAKRGAGQ